jgi:GNAT superfamily N-acetyltransferase
VDQPLTVVPAHDAACADLAAVFGTRGPSSRCHCQRYRLAPRETFAALGPEVLADRLREQTDCGHPGSGTTAGLVAYAGDVPVGWCAVAPRADHAGLVRHARVPWEGRDEDRADPTTWAVTCVLARAGHRRRGVSRALVAAAVPYARERGASALEGYPMTTKTVISEELHPGTLRTFLDAGFREVSRPTPRRAVVRVDWWAPCGNR